MAKIRPPVRMLPVGLLLALFLGLACNLSSHLPPPATVESVPQAVQPETSQPAGQPEPVVILPPTITPLPVVRIEQGDQAYQHGDWSQAAQVYQLAYLSSQEEQTKNAALLGLARAQLQASEPDQSISTLQKIIQEHPEPSHLPYAYFSLAQAYTAQQLYAEAADAYLNYLALRPGVIDAYVFNLRADALQAAGNYAEAANNYRTALQSPGMLDATTLRIKIARTHALAGDYQTAIALYDEIYASANNDSLKAQMDWYKGQAYTALGQMEEAYAAYLDAVENYPTAYDSYQGLVILVEAGVPVSDLNRGIVDYHARQYGVALAAFDRYFQSKPAYPAKARYYNGLTLRALGGYADAIKEWDKIIANYPEDSLWDDAYDQKAYTQWWHLGEYGKAIQTLLEFVSKVPNHPRAGEFLYDAGLVAERDGQFEQAAAYWERVAREYPGYEHAVRALFLAGIATYRAGNYTQAYEFFRSVLANANSFEDRAAAYLWQGKAQQALGNAEAAQAAWELAANTDPTGYYSERARDLLRNLAPFTPPEAYDLGFDLSAERRQAEEWLLTTFGLPADTDLSSPGLLVNDDRFQRGTELWRLGLFEQGRAEFENLRQSLVDNPADSFRLIDALVELGLYRSAIFCARQVLNLAGMDDASTMNAPVYFNHIRFGAYYSDLILPVAQEYQFHPLMILSLVRQESAFEGFVRSSAGARGLMQIIPTTGKEIAGSLGWPPGYTDDDLYRPMVSVRMGTYYLAKWRDRFDGDLYAALAAYNGGPGNSAEWRKLAQDDPDLFLEVIRFSETRNYIRGIYEIFCLYRRIYNRSP